ncbi:hypothetical protein LZQ00_11005 [Sphingobacterium sp. SRCM116780]|uniref:hypothetical protein n=1 Tax=Sphingobacterium sp. SRCM116780 TaxID=2907623 RepID=UPI001F414453|nr:hypothetical protein [Sphingobacterium sp. SRCM116780]UIR54805.1 hypothetical protein LZQ00_11005 [Sphingobacterium sp. SRCM116780]
MRNIKNRKIMFLIITLFFFVLFIIRCTTVNLNFGVFTHTNIPDLSLPLENGSYKIEKITNTIWCEIVYDPANNFYLTAEEKKVIKINSEGKAVFELNLMEKSPNNMPDNMDYYNSSHYVISWSGIYDLSKEKPYLEKFNTLLNEDEGMNKEDWIKQFNDLYASSEVVLFGYRKSNNGGKTNPLYFKKQGKWTILYTHKNIHVNSDEGHVKIRIGDNYIKDKFDRLYLLKDVKRKAYSNYLNVDDQFDNSNLAENQMLYNQQTSIETLSFKKEQLQEAPYTIIPVLFGGTVINKLVIKNSHFTFKTKATKGAGFNNEKVKNYIYLFDIPTKFQDKNALSFMYYKYPTNWNSDENQGVYVIKKNTE